MDTGAPLCTPVPDSSISRPIVVCRDPINRLDIVDVPRSPHRLRTSDRMSRAPLSRLGRMPLKLEPPFGPVVGLFPPKSVNQTICAVWNGDKSRFLSLCYRLAAP